MYWWQQWLVSVLEDHWCLHSLRRNFNWSQQKLKRLLQCLKKRVFAGCKCSLWAWNVFLDIGNENSTFRKVCTFNFMLSPRQPIFARLAEKYLNEDTLQYNFCRLGCEQGCNFTIMTCCCLKIHSLLLKKVTCSEYKVGEMGGKGFCCPSKKKNACYFLGVGIKRGRLDLILPNFQKWDTCTAVLTWHMRDFKIDAWWFCWP